MALSVQKVLQNMSHGLGGGDLSIEIDKFQVLNGAGEFLYSMYPWKWAQGRAALLDLRGSLSGSTATWTASTLTLTATGAFTNYTFVEGDEIEITDGTGATTGVYTIASKTSADAIVLASALAAGNLATGDIAWAIYPGTISLPLDCRDIISIHSSSTSNILQISLSSLDFINQARGANAITQSPSLHYAAIVYQGSPPVPLLEIWPSAGSNSTGALRIFYRSRWTHLYSDSAAIDIPEFMEELYIWIARAWARGYEREDEGSLHLRIAEVMASPLFMVAKKSDGMIQPFYGKTRHGGAEVWRRGRHSDQGWIVNRVEAPI